MVLGFIGSVRKIEGLNLVVDSISKLKDKKNIVFVVVGDGDELSLLQWKIKTLNLSKKILTIGRVPHDQVKEYYSIMDLLIYPRIESNVNNRVTPLKPLEAMAMGKTVLASDVEGLKELVIDGENGFLFKKDNIESLSEKIRMLSQDKTFLGQMGAKAQKWVLKNRDWKNFSEIYRGIYEEISK